LLLGIPPHKPGFWTVFGSDIFADDPEAVALVQGDIELI
jgi:hypothetical protein